MGDPQPAVSVDATASVFAFDDKPFLVRLVGVRDGRVLTAQVMSAAVPIPQPQERLTAKPTAPASSSARLRLAVDLAEDTIDLHEVFGPPSGDGDERTGSPKQGSRLDLCCATTAVDARTGLLQAYVVLRCRAAAEAADFPQKLALLRVDTDEARFHVVTVQAAAGNTARTEPKGDGGAFAAIHIADGPALVVLDNSSGSDSGSGSARDTTPAAFTYRRVHGPAPAAEHARTPDAAWSRGSVPITPSTAAVHTNSFRAGVLLWDVEISAAAAPSAPPPPPRDNGRRHRWVWTCVGHQSGAVARQQLEQVRLPTTAVSETHPVLPTATVLRVDARRSRVLLIVRTFVVTTCFPVSLCRFEGRYRAAVLGQDTRARAKHSSWRSCPTTTTWPPSVVESRASTRGFRRRPCSHMLNVRGTAWW